MQMPWGKFQKFEIEDIPSSYLKWLARDCDDDEIATAADEEWRYRDKYNEHFSKPRKDKHNVAQIDRDLCNKQLYEKKPVMNHAELMAYKQELIKQNPNQHIAIFGDEPWHPYNRVKLSSLISGDIKEEELYTETNFSTNSYVNTFYNNRIIDINRYANQVIDSAGKQHHYAKLIIATGSSPRIPSIDGICKKNIFTFRDLSDAQTLMGRSIRTRKTVIIGGGLLGLEAARAMQRFNTEVTVIEHNMWLMFNQLDNHAASYLRKQLENIKNKNKTKKNIKKKNKNMRSNSPFQKQDKCSIAKEKLKQSYIKRGKAKEFNSEIKTMACG